MQTLQVTSPAKDFFTSLRRYPSLRGEVEVSMRGLRAALGSVYRAAHGICERLVKLKVRPCQLSHYSQKVGGFRSDIGLLSVLDQ